MNKKISILIFASTLLFAEENGVLKKINDYRTYSGLNKLTHNKTLWKSSKNHSLYLSNVNKKHGHLQKNSNSKYYSGKTPSQRAEYVGYSSKFVLENLTVGIKDYTHSLEGLMVAIYHRFGFLNFNIDEIGFYRNDDVITYNMGNSYARQLCDNKSISGNYLAGFCQERVTMSKRIRDNSFYKVEINNPSSIVYPYPGKTDVLPAFYEETPDPVPDKIVTGNPISIQFNPSKVQNVKLESFELFEGGKKVRNTRLIHKNNDVNKKFSSKEFALYPLKRLKWGKRYSARVIAEVDGKRFHKTWSFFTKRLNGVIYNIKSDYQINTSVGNKFFYFMPEVFGKLRNVKSSCSGLKFIDSNTIRVSYKGKRCMLAAGGAIVKLVGK